MDFFTKLDKAMLHKSIWRAPDHIRIVWVTLLLMADHNGVIHASVGGIADAARKSVEETQQALALFMSPDPDSSDPEHEGRRVERCQGGFRLLNHAKYRSNPLRERLRERDRIRKRNSRSKPVTEATPEPAPAAPAPPRTREAQVELEIPANLQTPAFESAWTEWMKVRRQMKKPGNWHTMFAAQLQQLSEMGADAAVESIRTSIASGWRGLFPPKSRTTATATAKRGTSTPDGNLF